MGIISDFSGGGNLAPGVGQTLQYMGGKSWAGWSGEILVPQNTNTNLFNFISPNLPLKTTFNFGINDSSMTVNTQCKVLIQLNGILTFQRMQEYNPDEGQKQSTTLSIPLEFIIPPQAQVKIYVYQSDGNSQNCYGLLVCESLGV